MKANLSPQSRAGRRRILIMLLCLIMGLVVLYVFFTAGHSGFEQAGDAKAYILEHHNAETGAKNAVTAVYLNYRLWDTIFESMLLLLSALGVISFSWSTEDEK